MGYIENHHLRKGNNGRHNYIYADNSRENEGKVNLVAMATDAAIKSGAHAGNLIKAIASKVGGGGGGRPNMAQAGGKNPAGIPDAIASVKDALSGMIK